MTGVFRQPTHSASGRQKSLTRTPSNGRPFIIVRKQGFLASRRVLACRRVGQPDHMRVNALRCGPCLREQLLRQIIEPTPIALKSCSPCKLMSTAVDHPEVHWESFRLEKFLKPCLPQQSCEEVFKLWPPSSTRSLFPMRGVVVRRPQGAGKAWPEGHLNGFRRRAPSGTGSTGGGKPFGGQRGLDTPCRPISQPA